MTYLHVQEPIPTSLLKLSGEHVSRAVKMFSGILKYQGDTGEHVDEPQRIEIAQKLLHQGLKRPELKDELYMQLLKQTRGNPTPASRLKAWELFHLVAASMPPSKVGRGQGGGYHCAWRMAGCHAPLPCACSMGMSSMGAWVAVQRTAKHPGLCM